MASSAVNKRPVSAFVSKLYTIVDGGAGDLCEWDVLPSAAEIQKGGKRRPIPTGSSSRGDNSCIAYGFVVNHPAKFSSNVLPKYFKSSNFSSFVRQLHFYNFRKDDARSTKTKWRFSHPSFRQGRMDLLRNIVRKTAADSTGISKADLDALKQELSEAKNSVRSLRSASSKMLSLLTAVMGNAGGLDVIDSLLQEQTSDDFSPTAKESLALKALGAAARNGQKQREAEIAELQMARAAASKATKKAEVAERELSRMRERVNERLNVAEAATKLAKTEAAKTMLRVKDDHRHDETALRRMRRRLLRCQQELRQERKRREEAERAEHKAAAAALLAEEAAAEAADAAQALAAVAVRRGDDPANVAFLRKPVTDILEGQRMRKRPRHRYAEVKKEAEEKVGLGIFPERFPDDERFHSLQPRVDDEGRDDPYPHQDDQECRDLLDATAPLSFALDDTPHMAEDQDYDQLASRFASSLRTHSPTFDLPTDTSTGVLSDDPACPQLSLPRPLLFSTARTSTESTGPIPSSSPTLSQNRGFNGRRHQLSSFSGGRTMLQRTISNMSMDSIPQLDLGPFRSLTGEIPVTTKHDETRVERNTFVMDEEVNSESKGSDVTSSISPEQMAQLKALVHAYILANGNTSTSSSEPLSKSDGDVRDDNGHAAADMNLSTPPSPRRLRSGTVRQRQGKRLPVVAPTTGSPRGAPFLETPKAMMRISPSSPSSQSSLSSSTAEAASAEETSDFVVSAEGEKTGKEMETQMTTVAKEAAATAAAAAVARLPDVLLRVLIPSLQASMTAASKA